VDEAHPSNGLLQGCPHVWVKRVKGRPQDLHRHPEAVGSNPVKSLAKVT